MKKYINSLKGLLVLLSALSLCACSSPDVTFEDAEKEAEIIIDGTTLQNNAIGFYERELLEKQGDSITATFSCDMLVVNNSNSSANLMWQIYQQDINNYPMVTFTQFNKGNSGWKRISGSTQGDITLSNNNLFYLSTYQLNPADFKILIKNFKLVVKTSTTIRTYTAETATLKDNKISDNNWVNPAVPSLYETYKNYIPYVGIAAESNELNDKEHQKALKKHCNTTTMGNEFKPQFVCAWWGNDPQLSGETFTASNGITINTPKLNGLNNLGNYLNTCKTLGLKMRGHVLVWHSQTEEQFFRENYKKAGKLVSKDEMTARQEWYIKTVLEYVSKWEADNNNGEHIIWAWDVVNEAVDDGASGNNYLRTGSNWYSIYKDDTFIVNAFRFANKYAPADVKLCYNDYNEYQNNKTPGILKVLDAVIEAKNDAVLPTRIDAMGMQSHSSVNTSAATYEAALKKFIAKGLDIHVTELDIATETKYDPDKLAKHYKDYFTVFLNNRKTETTHGVECVTIWGFNDENTWINTPSQMQWHGNCTQYPLIFEKNENGEFVTKKAFDSVIEAANEYAGN